MNGFVRAWSPLALGALVVAGAVDDGAGCDDDDDAGASGRWRRWCSSTGARGARRLGQQGAAARDDATFTLSRSAEVPPVTTSATGAATITEIDATGCVTVTETYPV